MSRQPNILFITDDQPLPVDVDDVEDWPLRRCYYAAMVEMVDRQVGRMLDILDALLLALASCSNWQQPDDLNRR